MNFGEALEALKRGARVARAGWNGKGMFLYYVPPDIYPARTEIAKSYIGAMVTYHAYIAMKATDNTVFPWTPNMLDVLAEDWETLA